MLVSTPFSLIIISIKSHPSNHNQVPELLKAQPVTQRNLIIAYYVLRKSKKGKMSPARGFQ